MSKVLIIGCGGVASVAIHKCCQVPEVFTEICIASRTKSKCDKLAAELAPKTATKITTAQVDADKVDEVIALIKAYQPDLVMNIALPYQDLTIMDACLACGVNYMDTANYEPENTDDPEWRAIYEKRCKEAGFSAYSVSYTHLDAVLEAAPPQPVSTPAHRARAVKAAASFLVSIFLIVLVLSCWINCGLNQTKGTGKRDEKRGPSVLRMA